MQISITFLEPFIKNYTELLKLQMDFSSTSALHVEKRIVKFRGNLVIIFITWLLNRFHMKFNSIIRISGCFTWYPIKSTKSTEKSSCNNKDTELPVNFTNHFSVCIQN